MTLVRKVIEFLSLSISSSTFGSVFVILLEFLSILSRLLLVFAPLKEVGKAKPADCYDL